MSIKIEMKAPACFVIGPELEMASVKAGALGNALVHRYGALLSLLIKAKASGRPGPNAPTGDYRRSWTTRYVDMPTGAVAIVGTNKPQGRRLEYGFTGADSLGRVYDQPPFPHVGPAADEIEPQFISALQAIVWKALP